MRTPRALAARLTTGLTAVLLLGACSTAAPTDDGDGGTSGPRPTAYASSTTTPPATSAPTPGTSSPTSSTTNPTTTTQPAPDPASIEALIATRFTAGDLRLGREQGSTSAYRQYFVTYESNGLTISGRINIPRGTGPFPAVVLAHGYVDPAVYTNGETMLRERDHLARHGYVTLHIDYRNHAQSDQDPRNDANLRAGYAVDAINAGLALKKASYVDPGRLALIGRSMGGGVVYTALVVRPGLFRAAVAYAPVSSDTVDNFDKWVRRDASRSGAARAVIARLGTPEAEPAAWAATSPRTYFGRITEPLLIHHGTADEECPLSWSRESVAALEARGKSVELDVYPGGRHTLTSPQWDTSIRRTEAFLARHLR
ncbi:alpha/beta fold hydrolase [Terrabacter aerolatus]|uniref:Peptidase n=1 Tax=Terrabacter aerolatus TaxID=422442 RepID=A0A512D371_9MICO|nr:alpha/beta fold hydrolase [Terrabacter aerolatus]GEO30918.1 peptidase [Terrabacter aerolatus]